MAAEDDHHDQQQVSDEEVAAQDGEALPERTALSLVSPGPHGWYSTLPVEPPEVM